MSRSRLERVVQGSAFWTVTLLPMGYVPLLVLVPSRFLTLSVFGRLSTANLAALALGHGYATDEETK